MSITRHKFGFVQFEEEEEAAACLSAGSTAYISGKRVGKLFTFFVKGLCLLDIAVL